MLKKALAWLRYLFVADAEVPLPPPSSKFERVLALIRAGEIQVTDSRKALFLTDRAGEKILGYESSFGEWRDSSNEWAASDYLGLSEIRAEHLRKFVDAARPPLEELEHRLAQRKREAEAQTQLASLTTTVAGLTEAQATLNEKLDAFIRKDDAEKFGPNP